MNWYEIYSLEDCQIVREFCSFALLESFSGGYIDLAQISLVCLEGSIYFYPENLGETNFVKQIKGIEGKA